MNTDNLLNLGEGDAPAAGYHHDGGGGAPIVYAGAPAAPYDSIVTTPPPTADEHKRAAMEEDDDDVSPDAKKLRGEDGEAVPVPKRKGRKPGSLNRKKQNMLGNMDRGSGGPVPTWNDMFFALMAFKAKLGTFNVPAQTKLGKWVTKQRQEYSKLQRKKIEYNQCSELSEERIQVLDSLGFIWDTMLHENGRRWNQRFEELKQWKEEHGHCNVPQSTSLGQWVKIQRENKREADLKAAGKLPQRSKPKPCLAPDRIDKLNAIGFQWRVAAPVTGWDNRYNQLLEYAKQHNGDVNVPQYYPADKAFGRWVMKQRSEYSLRLRGLKSQLTDERVDRLNAIGFSWVAPNFKRKVGIGLVPPPTATTVAASTVQPPAGQPQQQSPVDAAAEIAKLPPMDKTIMQEVNEAHNPAPVVPQPVDGTAAPPPADPAVQHQQQQSHDSHLPSPAQPHPGAPMQQQQQPLVHHEHPPPVPMDAAPPPAEFQAMHPHDPAHAHHPHHVMAHHAPPDDQQQAPPPHDGVMHPHEHPVTGHQQQHDDVTGHQQLHDAIDDAAMEFL